MDIEAIQGALRRHGAARRLDEVTDAILEAQAQELSPFLCLVSETGRARLLSDLAEGLIDGAELKGRCEANTPNGRAHTPDWMKRSGDR